MKLITHLTSVHPENDVRIFFKECLSLRDLGYDVTLIAPALQSRVQDGIAIVAVKKTSSRLLRMTLVMAQVYWKALKTKADIYHFHDPELIFVGLLLQMHGKHVVYDVHEDVPRDILLKNWIPKWIRKPLSFLAEKFENFSASLFSGIVTVTPHIERRFSRKNAILLRNYPEVREFKINSSIGNAICYTGLINKQRGIVEMLNIADKADVTLHLAGVNRSEFLLSNTNERILYHGHIDRHSVQKIYQQSFVGLSLLHPGPTFNTSLPIKLFEYMAAGLPVIVSDFPMWRDIVEKHECGFCVDPFDIDAIVEKVCYLKNNKEIAATMGLNGRNAVEQYYNWESEVPKLTELYTKILS